MVHESILIELSQHSISKYSTQIDIHATNDSNPVPELVAVDVHELSLAALLAVLPLTDVLVAVRVREGAQAWRARRREGKISEVMMREGWAYGNWTAQIWKC